MIKLCFLGDAITHHLRRWSKYFSNLGYEVHIITFNPKFLPNYEPVKIHVLRKPIPKQNLLYGALNAIFLVLKTQHMLKQIQPHLVHCHDAGGYSWIAMLTGFHPLIVSTQGSDILIHAKSSKIKRVFTSWGLKNADLIHCDGYRMRDEIMKLGADHNKIKIVFFGTDVTKFRPWDNKDQLKKENNLSGNIVISTRRLDPVHNIETLIKSIRLVLESVPDTKFIIAGSGTEREYLINLSKSLGVYDSIRFLGMIEEDEMIKSLQFSDVYVATSLSESGIAASAAEAMACELPVINTDTGDIRLWIKDGENGFVIPPKTPEVVAEKMIYLLRNKEKRIEFGKINRKIIEERNNYHIEMAKMENIYKKLISSNHEI